MVCFVKSVTWFGKWCVSVSFEWLVKSNLNGEVITPHVIINNAERNVSGTYTWGYKRLSGFRLAVR